MTNARNVALLHKAQQSGAWRTAKPAPCRRRREPSCRITSGNNEGEVMNDSISSAWAVATVIRRGSQRPRIGSKMDDGADLPMTLTAQMYL